ncbi:MAG: hypothetical protein ACT4OY_07950 [Alphaproteobacteria bacterium]
MVQEYKAFFRLETPDGHSSSDSWRMDVEDLQAEFEKAYTNAMQKYPDGKVIGMTLYDTNSSLRAEMNNIQMLQTFEKHKIDPNFLGRD